MHLPRCLILLVLSILCISWNSDEKACSCPTNSIDPDENFCRNTSLEFIENKGQWNGNIQYQCELGGLNSVFLENNSFTYVIYDSYQTSQLHDVLKASEDIKEAHFINGHRYSVQFLDSKTPTYSEYNKRDAYNNYFLGNNQEKWAKQVSVYNRIQYNQLYDNIHLSTYGEYGDFKYDFIVEPGGNPADIKLKYTGQDSLYLENGDLVIETSVIGLREMAPYAYQIIGGIQQKVPCYYTLQENILSFAFPENYDKSIPLIIDPTVIGATLSGTMGSKNFGHSAAFDNAGNMYMAGISFGSGYPTTDGAFQENFGTGNVDIVVSKYNEDGSELIYATYIGGDGAEYPHSIITDGNGQLYIYGSCESENYPVTANAVQAANAGDFDIIISILSTDGDALVGSTYIGGENTDGQNRSTLAISAGDNFRGEIILDKKSNIYIASCSLSDDFPVTDNAFQKTFNDFGTNPQEGVLLKLNSDLSILYWSSYLGGEGIDMCYALRVDDAGNVYASGFAGHASFPMVLGGVQPVWPGGSKTAFVVKMSADGSTMLAGTYWGTFLPDEGSFVEIDEDGQIHILGVTLGILPITPDTYFFNAESHQFIVGFSNDLSTVLYSTVIGLGGDSGGYGIFSPHDFTPVAFMVDNCNNIYISGYYSVEGLPITSDALYTEGNSFYLAALSPLAKDLTFATYYGKSNHVDGGTSRFDKAGIIYQGVCSCLQDDYIAGGVMNTTPSAWATNQVVECDAGIFKIDFELSIVTAVAYAEPAPSGCAPFVLDLQYSGQDAESVLWDFGNGDTSNEFDTQYTFTEAGTYTVTQIAENLNSCNLRDTFYMEITVLGSTSNVEEINLCSPGNTIFLDATTFDATYNWSTEENQATIEVNESGIYWVDISITGCSRRDSFIVSVFSENIDILEPVYMLCDQSILTLDVTNPVTDIYEWNDGTNNPIYDITESGIYSVTITSVDGCEISDTVEVSFFETPVVNLGDDLSLCTGEIINLNVELTGYDIEWQDGSVEQEFLVTEPGIYSVTVSNNGCEGMSSVEIFYNPLPEVMYNSFDILCAGEVNGEIISSNISGGSSIEYIWNNGNTTADLKNLMAGDYTVTIMNEFGCTDQQSFIIDEPLPIEYEIFTDNLNCEGNSLGRIRIMNIQGGVTPLLFTIVGDSTITNPSFENLSPGTYEIIIEDANGCSFTEVITIEAFTGIDMNVGIDKSIQLGESTTLDGFGSDLTNIILDWNPDYNLSCDDCLIPEASPNFDTTYILTMTDTLTGCTYMDTIKVRVNRSKDVYIPNVFSPNNDGINDFFTVYGNASIKIIRKIRIYNRWGEVVFSGNNMLPNDPASGWDGTFKNRSLNPQVLAYIVEVEFLDGSIDMVTGDLTILK